SKVFSRHRVKANRHAAHNRGMRKVATRYTQTRPSTLPGRAMFLRPSTTIRGLPAMTRTRVFGTISVLLLSACHPRIGTPRDATTDYAIARPQFHTRLIKHTPPASAHPYTMPSDAFPLNYESGGLSLMAWISHASNEQAQPAVLFVHGGGGYDVEDWRMS